MLMELSLPSSSSDNSLPSPFFFKGTTSSHLFYYLKSIIFNCDDLKKETIHNFIFRYLSAENEFLNGMVELALREILSVHENYVNTVVFSTPLCTGKSIPDTIFSSVYHLPSIFVASLVLEWAVKYRPHGLTKNPSFWMACSKILVSFFSFSFFFLFALPSLIFPNNRGFKNLEKETPSLIFSLLS